MLLITAGLTTTSLLLVRRSVETNVRQSIAVNLRNSVAAFQDFRHERETMLTSDVALLADLPITRPIMAAPTPLPSRTHHGIFPTSRTAIFLYWSTERQGGRAAYQDPGLYRGRRREIFSAVSG